MYVTDQVDLKHFLLESRMKKDEAYIWLLQVQEIFSEKRNLYVETQ
jgi:hypothetical protein